MREDIKKILMVSGGVAFLAVLVLYSLYQGHDLLFGSKLSVSSKTSNDSSIITLSGTALHSKNITINGQPVEIDAKGAFNESIALMSGYNVITVASVNPFGKTKTETIYAYHPVTIKTAANIPPGPNTPTPEMLIN